MQEINNKGAGGIIKGVAAVIVDNKAYLSEIDGKIGDGDHGVNMAKGFGRAADRLDPEGTLSAAMEVLSDVLMSEIGGSMGPLYGMMFSDMADSLGEAETIDAAKFAAMIRAGLEGVQDIGSAQVGDKTLLDAFTPAVDAFDAAIEAGKSFTEALAAMKAAAEVGRDSTIDMVAKVGRSSRLGERSRGVLDAGATSCAMILGAFAEDITARLS
ncbi:dihydroxyacetone kinase subunit DhaL [Aliiruegeria sabulilitoris]|uniref:dihydroxyacetone kinase subunit DhaL n=1 Tax=Aliiruegeria sabulilitoris TaxID=1510458 RepID=UPI00082EA67B|nr:dihydroxyacetone kinase subunit DhaL [Aliiruegeria sabulilitoris]NDR58902.1 dihydroxyacetone kinase subunit L [Pseudoruegeria sp. M32A2M]